MGLVLVVLCWWLFGGLVLPVVLHVVMRIGWFALRWWLFDFVV